MLYKVGDQFEQYRNGELAWVDTIIDVDAVDDTYRVHWVPEDKDSCVDLTTWERANRFERWVALEILSFRGNDELLKIEDFL